MSRIFIGDLVEDIETAKRLIAAYPNVDVAMLMQVAGNRYEPVSARVAAIYTLGFTDDARLSYATLTGIVADPREPETVRDHALEALGYMDETFSDGS